MRGSYHDWRRFESVAPVPVSEVWKLKTTKPVAFKYGFYAKWSLDWGAIFLFSISAARKTGLCWKSVIPVSRETTNTPWSKSRRHTSTRSWGREFAPQKVHNEFLLAGKIKFQTMADPMPRSLESCLFLDFELFLFLSFFSAKPRVKTRVCQKQATFTNCDAFLSPGCYSTFPPPSPFPVGFTWHLKITRDIIAAFNIQTRFVCPMFANTCKTH